MNQSRFVVSWSVGRGAGAQELGTQRQEQPLRESLPHTKCDSSRAGQGQGSSGFSSFDGHGTRFDIV